MENTNMAAHSSQRVAVFMDTQNLYHSAKIKYGANVNYEEIISAAVCGRQLVRAFAYVIKSDESNEGKFFEALEDIGIEIRIKDLQVFHTGAKKADWDVGIAVDMIRLTEKVDVVVLASGDGDFLEVMRFCQSRGVRVEVLAFKVTSNNKLMDEADLFVDLSDNRFLIGQRRGYSRTSSYKPRVTKPAKPVNSTLYSASNLPSYLREQNSKAPAVRPSIYGSKGVRKVKPVVGLPAKKPNANSGPVSSIFGNRLNGNDYSVDNAFGNRQK
jgi:uncharacterized LabA/DUF88 family protein